MDSMGVVFVTGQGSDGFNIRICQAPRHMSGLGAKYDRPDWPLEAAAFSGSPLKTPREICPDHLE